MGSQKSTSNKRRSRKAFHNVEFDGQTYKLAIISKGRDIALEDKIDIAKVVCMMYATDEHSIENCLNHCGVRSHVTWFNWCNQIEDIEKLYLEAQRTKDRKYMVGLKRRARSLAERLLDGGYTVELVEKEGEPVTDKEGKTVIKTKKTKSRQIFIKPTSGLILNVLYNSDPRNFEKNPKPVEKMNKDVDIDPIEWVD